MYDAENGLGAIAAGSSRQRKADNYVALTEFVASVDGSTPEILEVMDQTVLTWQRGAQASKCPVLRGSFA